MQRRVITYTRVSTDEQAKEGYSLENQQEALSDHARYKKWELIGEYSDEGKTARTMKRDAFQYVLMLLRDGDADTLLIKYLDRLSRKLKDILDLFETAESEGWSIVILDIGG
jgi:site-specific DNA recombinase